MQHVMWAYMTTHSLNLNLTFTSRKIPEKVNSYLLESKNVASIYSRLENIRSVQRWVTSRTGKRFFFLVRNPEILPLKFHPLSYLKAMTDKRPNLETDHSPQTSVKVQNAWKITSASPKHLRGQLHG
jgi:hypothetical protein